MPLPLISAAEPSALQQLHRDVGAVRRRRVARMRPSAPMPGVPVAQSARPASASTRVGAVEVEQDEEVVAQAVVLGEAHAPVCRRPVRPGRSPVASPEGAQQGRERVSGSRRASRCGGRGGTTTAGGGRTGGCGGRPASTASSRRQAAVEVGEQLLVAERLAGGAGQAPRVGRAAAATSSRKPAAIWRAVAGLDAGGDQRRAAGRRPPGGTGSAGRPRARGRSDENGRPLPRVTSRARTTRRRLVGSMRAAADRVELGEAGVERVGVGLGLELGPHLGVPARDVEVVDDGPQVEAGARRRAGPGGPGASMSAMAPPGLGRLEPATVKSSHGSATSMQVVRHLGPLGRGRLGGADVHPRYTCIESTDTSSIVGSPGPGRGRGPTCPTRWSRRGPRPGGGGRAGAIGDGPYPRRHQVPLSDPAGRALPSE